MSPGTLDYLWLLIHPMHVDPSNPDCLIDISPWTFNFHLEGLGSAFHCSGKLQLCILIVPYCGIWNYDFSGFKDWVYIPGWQLWGPKWCSKTPERKKRADPEPRNKNGALLLADWVGLITRIYKFIIRPQFKAVTELRPGFFYQS